MKPSQPVRATAPRPRAGPAPSRQHVLGTRSSRAFFGLHFQTQPFPAGCHPRCGRPSWPSLRCAHPHRLGFWLKSLGIRGPGELRSVDRQSTVLSRTAGAQGVAPPNPKGTVGGHVPALGKGQHSPPPRQALQDQQDFPRESFPSCPLADRLGLPSVSDKQETQFTTTSLCGSGTRASSLPLPPSGLVGAPQLLRGFPSRTPRASHPSELSCQVPGPKKHFLFKHEAGHPLGHVARQNPGGPCPQAHPWKPLTGGSQAGLRHADREFQSPRPPGDTRPFPPLALPWE